MKIRTKSPNEKFYEQIVNEIKEDFKKRQIERRKIERQWELNLNYVTGNQYCEISANEPIILLLLGSERGFFDFRKGAGIGCGGGMHLFDF